MESKMFLVVLNIILFSCLIQSSFALKCFQCDSSRNLKCNDLTDKSLQPQECVTEGFLNQARIQQSIQQSVQQYGNVNVNVQDPVEFCGACDNGDGCNSANSMKLFSALVVFGTMLSVASLFA